MADGDIYLGLSGSETKLTPFGRKLHIKSEQIVREGRTVSGRMVRDVINTKAEITLEYDWISGNDLTVLNNLYNLDSELSLKIHVNSTIDSYVVLMDPVSKKRELLTSDGGMWSGVSVVLKEV
jgi:hypothetical protein